MSEESKRLKIFTIITLIAGLGITVAGIVLGIMAGTSLPTLMATASGVLALVLGVRGALIANVPSNTDALVKLAIVFTLAQVALAIIAVFVPRVEDTTVNVAAVILIIVAWALSLIVFILARVLSKRLLAK